MISVSCTTVRPELEQSVLWDLVVGHWLAELVDLCQQKLSDLLHCLPVNINRSSGESSLRSPALLTKLYPPMNLLNYTPCWNITFRLVVCVRLTLICCLYLVSVHVSVLVAAPTIWNTLPLDIRNSPSMCCFHRHLKTFFYNLVFRPS